jgi:hypothetical protein
LWRAIRLRDRKREGGEIGKSARKRSLAVAQSVATELPRGHTPPAPREAPQAAAGGFEGAPKRLWTSLAVIGLLAAHFALAERSLVQENPTVDEVVHLPAGVTYLQKGTFRLYHHNPPLIKMVAAIPVVWARPNMAKVYQQESWLSRDPSQTTFSQSFARFNIDRYFELFRVARMVMPLFSIAGGLAVFAWSRRLYGTGGGLLSLCLWVFCPNILAHCRLITTDLGSTALGVTATFSFWLYLRNPSWARAAGAGVMLGLAQLTKFSMLLLYAVWPFLWLVRLLLSSSRAQIARQAGLGVARGFLIVALSMVTIDAGYFFEGVGTPMGRFEFASKTLTKPVVGGIRPAPSSSNELFAMLWSFRENRFRGTFLARLPSPLPEHYMLGFDEQKIESEGIPNRLSRAYSALRKGDLESARRKAVSSDESVGGYPVYLNGEMRNSGWWYYYICTLFYKVPEGTWMLVLSSLAVLVFRSRPPEAWADEICLWTIPVVVLLTMSFLTDINLGLRYVLSIAPYVFISTGKVVPWIEALGASRRRLMRGYLALCLGLTAVAALSVHPHYLAYFNWISGGPDRVPARLIDSNLDWGQDLVGLREWCREHAPGQPIGLAYFGQINPNIFALRGDNFDWFLPPVRPGTIVRMPTRSDLPPPPLVGPAPKLAPAYYAISATLVYGLPWRLYDSSPAAWEPAWNAFGKDAFGYFRRFEPIHKLGHSIYVYKLSQEDVARAADLL